MAPLLVKKNGLEFKDNILSSLEKIILANYIISSIFCY